LISYPSLSDFLSFVISSPVQATEDFFQYLDVVDNSIQYFTGEVHITFLTYSDEWTSHQSSWQLGLFEHHLQRYQPNRNLVENRRRSEPTPTGIPKGHQYFAKSILKRFH